MPELFSVSVPTRRDARAAPPGAGNPDKLATEAERAWPKGWTGMRSLAALGQTRKAASIPGLSRLAIDPMAPPHWLYLFIGHDTSSKRKFATKMAIAQPKRNVARNDLQLA